MPKKGACPGKSESAARGQLTYRTNAPEAAGRSGGSLYHVRVIGATHRAHLPVVPDEGARALSILPLRLALPDPGDGSRQHALGARVGDLELLGHEPERELIAHRGPGDGRAARALRMVRPALVLSAAVALPAMQAAPHAE